MISFFQAGVMGLLQGVAELFPVSSLGHSVILPQLLGWQIDQSSASFVMFLVATHFATALVLFLFFLNDWMLIWKGFVRTIKSRTIDQNDAYAKLALLIILTTIPVGLLGVLLQKKIEVLFASAFSAAVFLVANGFVLYGCEILRKQKALEPSLTADARIAKISWLDGLKVGAAQCLALIPGFSRTGTTLSGGLIVGLDHESAARFSFLLATPVIFAAALLKLPHLFGTTINIWGPILFGTLCAAGGAYFSVKYLTGYFKTKNLTPFAAYCVIAGILSCLILVAR